MDEQVNSPAVGDSAQRWREEGARHGGEGYWQAHEIVQRSPEEIRRGEAPAYVRRRR